MTSIILYNNLTYSLAAIILLSTIIHSTKRRYITAFIIILAAGLLLTRWQQWIMTVNTVAFTICFAKGRKGIRKTLYDSMTVIFLLWGFIVTVSSFATLVTPGWHGTAAFNYFMGGGLLTSTIAIKVNSKAMDWYRQLEHKGYAIALEIVILLFFSFVMPWYYPAIAVASIRKWAVFSLTFMLIIGIVVALINRMKDVEHHRRELVSQAERREAYAGQVQAQYEKMVVLKHYYTKLYHSLSPFIRDNDMTGLRLYFDKHITPIQREQIQNGNQLTSVKNTLLRNLLDVTAGQAATMEHVIFDMDISGEILLPDSMELDIFEIMSNLIDNAFNELSEQSTGLLRIGLHEADGHVLIHIANTITGDIDIEQIYNQKQDRGDGHGHGLKRVRAIVYRHPGAEHLTYKDGMFEGKEILVQQIKITLEGG